MRRPYSSIKIGVSALLFLFMMLFINQPVHADVIENSRSGILPDKVWTITFSNNVNYDYVNTAYICVYDGSGNEVDLDLKVNPSNQKQVIVKPKSGAYTLGKTYTLIISKGFSDEKGNKIGQDYKMQFSIKKQLIDTADFKVQVNKDMGVAVISINSITSPDIRKYKVEGQDDPEIEEEIGEKAYILGSYQNVTVYFYDDSGKEIGSCLLNIQKASDSQVLQIMN